MIVPAMKGLKGCSSWVDSPWTALDSLMFGFVMIFLFSLSLVGFLACFCMDIHLRVEHA